MLKQSVTVVFLSYQKIVDELPVNEVPQILFVITRRTQGGYRSLTIVTYSLRRLNGFALC